MAELQRICIRRFPENNELSDGGCDHWLDEYGNGIVCIEEAADLVDIPDSVDKGDLVILDKRTRNSIAVKPTSCSYAIVEVDGSLFYLPIFSTLFHALVAASVGDKFVYLQFEYD